MATDFSKTLWGMTNSVILLDAAARAPKPCGPQYEVGRECE